MIQAVSSVSGKSKHFAVTTTNLYRIQRKDTRIYTLSRKNQRYFVHNKLKHIVVIVDKPRHESNAKL